MSIDKISPVAPSYPSKKLDKVIRDEQYSDREQARQNEKKDHKKKNGSFNESSDLHIDEIV